MTRCGTASILLLTIVAWSPKAVANAPLSVQAFGARCDAVEGPNGATGSDDFPAFQAAVATAKARGGGTIRVTAAASGSTGKCLWKLQGSQNPTLRLPSNTTLALDPGIRILVEGQPNGVNGYATGAVVNDDQTNGNTNVSVIGGAFKAAGPRHGSVFVAFKRVAGGTIKSRFLDNNASARVQVAHSSRIEIDIEVAYESGPWKKVVHPIQRGNPWGFEDGVRIGSGSHAITVRGNISSGDDAIALSNEPSETAGAKAGADIHNIRIGPVKATTRAGNALRMYQEASMTAGQTYDVVVNDLVATPYSRGKGATGISIADYSKRRAIRNIALDNIWIDAAGISGENSAGLSLINTSTVSISRTTILNAPIFGLALSDAPHTTITSVDIRGTPRSVDGLIATPYLNAGGSHNSSIDHSRIVGFGGRRIRLVRTTNFAIGQAMSSEQPRRPPRTESVAEQEWLPPSSRPRAPRSSHRNSY